MYALMMHTFIVTTPLLVADATTGDHAWELSAVAVAWGAALWWAARWLTRDDDASRSSPPAAPPP